MKKVIVAGAAGFLGSHLCKYHLERGDQVLGIDDFCSSDSESEHFINLKTYENFDFLRYDINYLDAATLDCHLCDLIYNFACPASPKKYQDMPIHTMLTSVVGTEKLLSHAENNNAVIVHASTSEIYGDPTISPQSESYRGCVNSYGPRACYDEGKRAAEALCWDYMNLGTDARLVRIFNTYGPNMDPYDGRVVSNLIVQALKGEKLTIYGDGTQTRSFCYVDDLIRGITTLAELKENPRTPINLGNPYEFTINELAKKILILNGSGDVEYKPLPVDDPIQRCPDISYAKKFLNWQPYVDLDLGLRKTFEYFNKIL